MKTLCPVILLALLAGCSTVSESNETGQQTASTVPKVALPRTYWSLDSATQRTRTVVPGPLRYVVTIVTKCLNDSAVINRVLLDDGPTLDISHNYESDISIARQGQVWQQARLTKEIFQQRAEILKIGPLVELHLSRMEFLRYKAPNFYFRTRVGVPDSDIFAEAEVILTPGVGTSVTSVREQAGVE